MASSWAYVRARLGLGRDAVRGARAYLVRHRDDTGRSGVGGWSQPSWVALALDAAHMPGARRRPLIEKAKGALRGRASKREYLHATSHPWRLHLFLSPPFSLPPPHRRAPPPAPGPTAGRPVRGKAPRRDECPTGLPLRRAPRGECECVHVTNPLHIWRTRVPLRTWPFRLWEI